MSRGSRLGRRGSRGQSMVEYLVVAILLIAIVAVPIDGHSSVIEMLLQAIHTAYTRFLGALSIPM